MPRDTRTYITVHDGMPDHPKIEELSDKAFRVLLKCWCWCSRNKSDGHIPSASWVKRGPARARQELIDAGLAEETATGVHMHDYLEHQRSAEEIEALSAARAEAGRRGGNAKAKAVANAKADAKQTSSKTVADTDTENRTTTRTKEKGDRYVTLRPVAGTTPRTRHRCQQHAHIPDDQPGPNCLNCQRQRLNDEAEAEVTTAAVNLSRRIAIDNCPDCDDNGLVEIDDRTVARCTHHRIGVSS